MKKRLQVTAIIPSKDRYDRTMSLIQDLHRQDYPQDRLAILVVDDGSSRPYHIDNGAVVIRHEQSLGAQQSRNQAIWQATGDIMLMLDDDIEIKQPDFISTAVDILQQRQEVVLVCGRKIDVIHDEKGDPVKSIEFSLSKPRFYSGDLIRTHRIQAGPIDWPCNCYFVRRRELLATGGYEGIYGLNGGHSFREESDIHARLRKQGHQLWFTPAITFKHHVLQTGGHGPSVGKRLYWIAHNHLIFLRRHIRFWPLRAVGFLIDIVRYSWVQSRLRYTFPMVCGYFTGWRNALRDRGPGKNRWLETP